MGKSSAPPAPDYAAAATAQGEANRETAQFNAGANRVNQITPQGSSTWSIRPGADLNNPQPGDYIQTTTLSPEQQALYQQQTAIENALMQTAGQQLGRVSDTFNTPIDLSGLPAWRTSGQGVMQGGGASSASARPTTASSPGGSMPQTSNMGAPSAGMGYSGAMAGQGGGGYGMAMPMPKPSGEMTGAGAPGAAQQGSIDNLIAAMMSRKQA